MLAGSVPSYADSEGSPASIPQPTNSNEQVKNKQETISDPNLQDQKITKPLDAILPNQCMATQPINDSNASPLDHVQNNQTIVIQGTKAPEEKSSEQSIVSNAGLQSENQSIVSTPTPILTPSPSPTPTPSPKPIAARTSVHRGRISNLLSNLPSRLHLPEGVIKNFQAINFYPSDNLPKRTLITIAATAASLVLAGLLLLNPTYLEDWQSYIARFVIVIRKAGSLWYSIGKF